MRSEEVVLLFLLALVGVPLALWFFQDSIFGFLQGVDVLLLKAFSFVPVVGDYYGNVNAAYRELQPSQLTWQHIWIAGQIAWRPIMLLVFVPILLRWAWKAWKVRRAQAFETIDKNYILKHCGTKQTVPECGARQQWVVRRWYHHYGLHLMQWGSAEWNLRLRKGLAKQLGRPSDDPDAQALLHEFAVFMHGQAVLSFGKELADTLPPSALVAEATKSHAYSATALVRILAAARDTFGVISPQGFRNRLFQNAETMPVWFALNGLNRQTTHIESLGVLSHFYVEVAEGEALVEPQLENAIQGLEMYRTHLIDQRKLKDLDESETYAEQERQKALKERGEEELLGKGEAGYLEDEQVMA